MNRRGFLGMSLAAAGMVFVPRFGRWHRQGSGLYIPTGHELVLYEGGRVWKRIPFHPEDHDTSLFIPDDRTLTWSATYPTPCGPVTEVGTDTVRVWNGTLTFQWPHPLVRFT